MTWCPYLGSRYVGNRCKATPPAVPLVFTSRHRMPPSYSASLCTSNQLLAKPPPTPPVSAHQMTLLTLRTTHISLTHICRRRGRSGAPRLARPGAWWVLFGLGLCQKCPRRDGLRSMQGGAGNVTSRGPQRHRPTPNGHPTDAKRTLGSIFVRQATFWESRSRAVLLFVDTCLGGDVYW